MRKHAEEPDSDVSGPKAIPKFHRAGSCSRIGGFHTNAINCFGRRRAGDSPPCHRAAATPRALIYDAVYETSLHLEAFPKAFARSLTKASLGHQQSRARYSKRFEPLTSAATGFLNQPVRAKFSRKKDTGQTRPFSRFYPARLDWF